MRLLVFPVRLIDTIVCFFDQFNVIKQMGLIFVNEDLKLEENEAKHNKNYRTADRSFCCDLCSLQAKMHSPTYS